MPVPVSVVIPTYEASAWIEETLESVVRQTYPADALAILVVDDASPDDTVSVVRRFLGRCSLKSRVVVREVNAGPGATRNAGWKMADGDWIQFLDQDDQLAPHKIELQAQAASRAADDVAVIYSDWIWKKVSQEDGCWRPSGPVHAPFVDDDPLLGILQQLDFGHVGPTLIRKSFLTRVGGFGEEPNLGEDIDLMLRLAMAGGQFREVRSEEVAFFYRQTPGSLGQSLLRNAHAMRNLLHTFRSVEEFLRDQSPDRALPEDLGRALAMRYSRFASFYYDDDPESFCMLMGWIKGLGVACPINLSRKMRVLSSVTGLENAVRLRAAIRQQSLRLRPNRSTYSRQ
jgi:glycosyltransferase involved in cell wall biosynthesis